MAKLILLLIFVTLPALAKPAACLRDFRVAQQPVAHHLSGADLARLESYAKAGRAADGWQYLASLGDPYALVSWKVVSIDPDLAREKFHKMVLHHWHSSVGRELTAETFQQVANEHFRHYVEILETGFWPDSDQILLSYLTAARDAGLPDKVVFDEAWVKSGLNKILGWEKIVHLPKDRWVRHSLVCADIKGSHEFFSLVLGLIKLPF